MKYIILIFLNFFIITFIQTSDTSNLKSDADYFEIGSAIYWCNMEILEKTIFNNNNLNININYQTKDIHPLNEIKVGSHFLHIIIVSVAMRHYNSVLVDILRGKLQYLKDPEMHLHIFKKLLDVNNININLQDINGNTPIMKAIIYSLQEFEGAENLENNPAFKRINDNKLIYHEMIKILLVRGADLTIKNNNNKCFLDYINNSEIKKIYEEFRTPKIKELNNSLNAALPNVLPDLNKLICEYIY